MSKPYKLEFNYLNIEFNKNNDIVSLDDGNTLIIDSQNVTYTLNGEQNKYFCISCFNGKIRIWK